MKTIRIGKREIPLRLPKSNPKIVAAVHPAWLIRGKQVFAPVFTRQILRGTSLAYTNGPMRPDWKFELRPSPERVREYLLGKPWFAFDVETPETNHTKITMCSFSAEPYHALVVPWQPQYIATVKPFLESRDSVKIAHNADFDVTAMEASDIIVPGDRVWCTATAANVIEPDYPVALHLVCSLHFNYYLYWKELHKDRRQQQLWSRVLKLQPGFCEWEQIYCCLDSGHTFMLWRGQKRVFDIKGNFHTFADQMTAFTPLRRMQQRGLRVDKNRQQLFLRKAQDEKDGYSREVGGIIQEPYGERRRKLEQGLEAAVATRKAALVRKRSGDASAIHPHKAAQGEVTRVRNRLKRVGKGFNIDSDYDWRWLLFSHFKLPHVLETKGGKPSVNKEALHEMQARSSSLRITKDQLHLLDILEKNSSLDNRISTFIDVSLDAEGVAHPGYQLYKTATSRLASGSETVDADKPAHSLAYNAQNIPQDLRRMYRPFDARNVFLEVDWEQIELRRMAWRLRVKSLMDALLRGVDIHTENAAVIFQVAAHFITSAQRTHAKRFTHGVDYGAGARKIARVFRITEAHARECIRRYFERWPGLREARERLIKESVKARRMTNGFGWSRRVLAKDAEKILAFYPQSEAAGMMKQTLPLLFWEGEKRGIPLLTTTHDSFLFELRPERLPEAVEWLEPVMEREFEQLSGFSCPCSFTVGVTWGKGLRDMRKKHKYLPGIGDRIGRLQRMRSNAVAA